MMGTFASLGATTIKFCPNRESGPDGLLPVGRRSAPDSGNGTSQAA